MRDVTASTVEDQKGLAKMTEKAIVSGTVAMAEADAKVAAARERRERLKRGEDVAGGLGKPMTREDLMKMIGWTEADARRAALLNEINRAGGWEIAN
jgi:hypothetical protein